MPVQGIVALRAHQFGKQTSMGTVVPAQRRYAFSGVPDVNPNWEDPEGDFGSIDLIAPPTRGIPTYAAPLTAPKLFYNELQLMLAAVFGGGVTASGAGTAKTRHWTPASLTPDDFDLFTYEFGDDVVTDWWQLGDGILTDLTIDSPEAGAGPLSASMTWKFASAASTGSTDFGESGTVPTSGLSIDTLMIPILLQDAKIYIDSDPDNIGDTQLTDALHNFSLHIGQAVDEKRYVNGTQSYDLQAYGRGKRVIDVNCQYAKTEDTVGTGSEADAWFSQDSVPRYVSIVFTSPDEAETMVPYSWGFSLPMRYYTRTDGAIGGNSTVNLAAKAFYEPDTDVEYAFDTSLVNTVADADF